jgi:signal transduction histidine kinase
MSTVAALKHVSIFKHLADAQVERLAAEASRLELDAGQVVFREGDTSDSLYAIVTGSVLVYREDGTGSVVELDVLGEGSVFGELALLDSGPRSASIATRTACALLVVDRPLFATLIHESSAEVILRILADLSQRMRAANERRIQEQLAKQAIRAEMELERHRSLSQMVAGVAHEVNTPLGVANTAAAIIRQELTSPALPCLFTDRRSQRAYDDMLEALDLMERNIPRAHKLVHDFKKVSVGQLTDVKEEMNLPAAVAEIVDLFKISARQARLEIMIDNALKEAAQTWLGYYGYLSQVLLNLLTNVEHYAYPRGSGGRVKVTLVATEQPLPTFTVTVRDWGKGIPPDELPHVFDAFFTTGRGAGGSGLGLAIVHNLVTGPLQGTIHIASELGAGTTVTFTFPQVVADQKGGAFA